VRVREPLAVQGRSGGGRVNAETFNALYEVGVPVLAYPGARPEDIPSARRLITRTRSKATVLGGHTDVVWVDGHSACIALDHIDPVTEDEYEAAKQAEAGVTQGDESDKRRRIYIDGHDKAWIDSSTDSNGIRWIAPFGVAAMEATRATVRAKTGSLREIGRCW